GCDLRFVSYAVSYACGNVNVPDGLGIITVTDTEAPVWDEEDVELTADCAEDIDSLLAEHVPTATDNCNDVIVTISSEETTEGDCTGSYLRTVGYVESGRAACREGTMRFVTVTVTEKDAPRWEQEEVELRADGEDD